LSTGVVMGDEFGFGTLNFARINSPAPPSLFNLNTGYDPPDDTDSNQDSPLFWAEDQVAGMDTFEINPIPAGEAGQGTYFAIEPGAAVTAAFSNAADSIFQCNGVPCTSDESISISICPGNGCEAGENSCSCPQDCGSVCGDGCCNGSENAANCISDCASICGDGLCTGSEGTCTCSVDCGSACGDGCCNGSENSVNCATDCPATCGDLSCNGLENTCSCFVDCGSFCGDGCCNGSENSVNCSLDCGSMCGDGSCTGMESACSCQLDCPDVCGDMCCTGAENPINCNADCGVTPIPTVSEWGIAAMVLLVMATGTIVFRRKTSLNMT